MSAVTLPDTPEAALPPPQINWYRAVGFRRAFFGDRLENLVRLGQAVGDMGEFAILDQRVVLVNTAEYAADLLVRHNADVHVFGHGDSLLTGNGIGKSGGEFHRRQRRILAPPLSRLGIAASADMISQYSRQTAAAWGEGVRIPIAQAMDNLSLQIIGAFVFGCDMRDFDQELSRTHERVRHFNELKETTAFRVPWKTRQDKRRREASQEFNRVVFGLIQERRKSPQAVGDLLSLLLTAEDEDGNTMSDQQVHDEAVTMLLGGYHNIAGILTWAFCLVAENPAIQARIQEEIDGALQGRLPGYEDLPCLPYTRQVFQEAARLASVVTVTRQVVNAINIGGYRLAAGTVVMVFPYLIHHDPRYWPEPARFDPDRFCAQEEQQRLASAYLPFGGGSHLCIGKHFAVMEGQLVLATILQTKTLSRETRQPLKPDARHMRYPQGDIHLCATRRQRAGRDS